MRSGLSQLHLFSSTASVEAVEGRDRSRPQKYNGREGDATEALGEPGHHTGRCFSSATPAEVLLYRLSVAELQSDALAEAARLNSPIS